MTIMRKKGLYYSHSSESQCKILITSTALLIGLSLIIFMFEPFLIFCQMCRKQEKKMTELLIKKTRLSFGEIG